MSAYPPTPLRERIVISLWRAAYLLTGRRCYWCRKRRLLWRCGICPRCLPGDAE